MKTKLKYDTNAFNKLLFCAVRNIKGNLSGGLAISFKTEKARRKHFYKYYNNLKPLNQNHERN